MTNEEAIKVLKMVEAHGLANEAKNVAIKAIEENEEWHKLKLICANEGIIVYKTRSDEESSDNATLTVADFENDAEFMENINKVSTEELFNCLEYYGCDGYYGELHGCVLEELKKRVR